MPCKVIINLPVQNWPPYRDGGLLTWSSGILTSVNKVTEQVQARAMRFVGNVLYVGLSDGREISVPLDQIEWLAWLAKATPQQRAKWSIEPGGYAIQWDDLDDGIEVRHLLSLQPLA